MRFHSFLIKYGEIGIKGKNRYMFEDALVRQIRYALKDVDGEFQVEKKDLTLKWRGSSNQRVIDVPATLREGQIVLHAD